MTSKCSRILQNVGILLTNMSFCCYLSLLIGLYLPVSTLGYKTINEFACFNTIFEITCQANQVIVFQSARYGRNDAAVAQRCQVPYQHNCDIDVQFELNRVCAGKQTCSLAVNTALFSDPCGFEEFLRVSYQCVPGTSIKQVCYGQNEPPMVDHGYIASPNYPQKYSTDADCYWKISVQKRQAITVTILDFQLDVKKGGQCNDYLEISAGDRVYFSDCGSSGKQDIAIDSSNALVHFSSSQGSLAQRGFMLSFKARGPGCPDLEDLENGWADYYIQDDILYANVSCQEGFHFSGTEITHELIQCSGQYWNTILTPCVPTTPPTTPPLVLTSADYRNNTSVMDDSGSLIGIALGVVSAILLITLLLVLALYFHKRRRNAERKLDQWRFVINNLQENSMNEENQKRSAMEGSGVNVMATPMSNVRKAGKRGAGPAKSKNKKVNNKEDEWQGRNLLTSPNYDEEEMLDIMALEARDVKTMLQFPMPAPDNDPLRQPQHVAALSRKNSKSRSYSLARSRDSQLESPSYWMESADPASTKSRPPAPRKEPIRVKRAKSGQWELQPNKTFAVVPAHHHHPHNVYPTHHAPGAAPGLAQRQFTQSAPDLLNIPEPQPQPPVGNGDIFCCHAQIYSPADPTVTYPKMGRSSTLSPGGTPGYRGPKPVTAPKPPPRGKYKC